MQIVPNPLSGVTRLAGNLLIIQAARRVCGTIRRRNFVLARRTTDCGPSLDGGLSAPAISRSNRELGSEQGRR